MSWQYRTEYGCQKSPCKYDIIFSLFSKDLFSVRRIKQIRNFISIWEWRHTSRLSHYKRVKYRVLRLNLMTFDCKGHSFLWKGTEGFLSAWWGNHDAIIAIFFIFMVTAAFFGFGMSESASLYSCGLQHVCLFLCQTLESYVRFSCSIWYLSWFFVLFLYIWNQCWAVVFKAHACVCA